MLTFKFEQVKRQFWNIALVFVLLLVGFAHALPAGINADFFPLNGDFQNYNVVRRLLGGQFPFRDFAAYLGCGHLFLGSFTTFLIGGYHNNLMDSKIAFQFLALFSFSVISLTIFLGVLPRKKITLALALTILIELFMLSTTFHHSSKLVPREIYDALNAALSSGNSARFLREMAPALYIAMAVLLSKLICNSERIKLKGLYFPIVYGIPTGIIIFYSNDYGLGAAVCSILIYSICMIFADIPVIEKTKRIVLFFVLMFIAFFVVGTLITGGSIGSYINSILGTGGMQSWYYNTGKSFYILDFDRDIYILCQGAVAYWYFLLFVRNFNCRDKRIRFGIPLFMNAVAFAASNEYKLFSGSFLHEVACTILLLTLISEITRFVLTHSCNIVCTINSHFKNLTKRTATFYVLIAGAVWSCNSLASFSSTAAYNRAGLTYVNSVGYLSYLGKPILSTDEFLTSKDKVFSTYASALETYRGSYQPSGYDYIIHVLGVDAKDVYMKNFRDGDFSYVATLRESFSVWEYWVKNANWYFYRELYKNYEPVYANTYELFWKKKDRILTSRSYARMNIEIISDSQRKITIDAPGVSYGIADVRLEYSVKKTKSIESLLVFNTMLYVNNFNATKISNISYPDDWYYLPGSSSGKHIGITIVDGHGEITVYSQPSNNTYIESFNAELGEVFADDCLDYAEVINAVESANIVKIHLENTAKNRKLIQNANSVEVNGEEAESVFDKPTENNSPITVIINSPSASMKNALIGHSYYPVIRIKKKIR